MERMEGTMKKLSITQSFEKQSKDPTQKENKPERRRAIDIRTTRSGSSGTANNQAGKFRDFFERFGRRPSNVPKKPQRETEITKYAKIAPKTDGAASSSSGDEIKAYRNISGSEGTHGQADELSYSGDDVKGRRNISDSEGTRKHAGESCRGSQFQPTGQYTASEKLGVGTNSTAHPTGGFLDKRSDTIDRLHGRVGPQVAEVPLVPMRLKEVYLSIPLLLLRTFSSACPNLPNTSP